jgi:hypothetical protein
LIHHILHLLNFAKLKEFDNENPRVCGAGELSNNRSLGYGEPSSFDLFVEVFQITPQ